MDHSNYFSYLAPSTPDDVQEFVFDALKRLPDEWQGYEVSFSQYGLAQMLVDLGHGRLENDGSIIVKAERYVVHFYRELPFIGIAVYRGVTHYAVIIPGGIAIEHRILRIK